MFFVHKLVACLSNSTDVVAVDSGAFDVSKNAATIAGTVGVGVGGCLAIGVGATVLPAPVLGFAGVGGVLLAAGHWDDITGHFGDNGETDGDTSGDTTETPVSDSDKQSDTTEPSVVEVVKS